MSPLMPAKQSRYAIRMENIVSCREGLGYVLMRCEIALGLNFPFDVTF